MAEFEDAVGVVEALERLLEDSSGVTYVGDPAFRHVFHREGDVRGYEYSLAFYVHDAPLRSIGSDVLRKSLPAVRPIGLC